MVEHEIFSARTQAEFIEIAQRHGCIFPLLDSVEDRTPDGRRPLLAAEKEQVNGPLRLFLFPDEGDDAPVERLFLMEAYKKLF